MVPMRKSINIIYLIGSFDAIHVVIKHIKTYSQTYPFIRSFITDKYMMNLILQRVACMMTDQYTTFIANISYLPN